ncbi:MAG: class I SAM-dependent methyltransferase [Candidatus Rokubacteria bacterium]|nr:class I SAM-dependent methyltransferase [Candidatus Rokubacteria bacterium]
MKTGFIGGAVGYRLLRYLGRQAARGSHRCDGSAYCGRSKVEVLFGPEIWTAVAGKVVIDFGCGSGAEAVEIAQRGARRVIGIDIRPASLEQARSAAARAGVADRCCFADHTDEIADVIVSIDGFEHYDHPEQVLRAMRRRTAPGGRLFVSFGPPWFHPLGGHLFSVFPWAHLVFTERALVRWRADFKSDGATRFGEVEGGLNQMTIHRFRRLLEQSEFEVEHFEAVPIKRLRWLSNALLREFVTSLVRCTLVPRTQRGRNEG